MRSTATVPLSLPPGEPEQSAANPPTNPRDVLQQSPASTTLDDSSLPGTKREERGSSASAGSPGSVASTSATSASGYVAAQPHQTPIVIASHVGRTRPLSVAAPRHRAHAASSKRPSAAAMATATATAISSPDESAKDFLGSPASSPSDAGGGSGTRHHHHPDVWESHKLLIREIYINENKPLKELMAIMREKGFKATPRMFKSKFAQWGFVKNNKKKDVAMMLRMQRQRDAEGKRTAFNRHGRAVDVDNYLKRKGITRRDLEEADVEDAMPIYLRALTPPPSDPHRITLPNLLYAQDVLVTCFRDLTSHMRDTAMSSQAFMSDFAAYFDGPACEATRDFSRACWFFSKGYMKHGAALSQRSFSAVHLLVTNPSALGLFDLLIAVVLTPDINLTRELWKYLAAYSEAVLGSNTITRLFRALEDVFTTNPIETSVDFVFSCIDNIIGMLLQTRQLADTVAPTVSAFLIADLVLYRSERRCPNLEKAVSSTARLLGANMALEVPMIVRLLPPAGRLWLMGPQDEESFQFCYHSVQQPPEVLASFGGIGWLMWQVMADFHRTHCPPVALTSTPRHGLAIYALENAINAADGLRGFGEFQVFANLETLENWYKEAGDLELAMLTSRRRARGLQDYLDSIEASNREVLRVAPASA
ncbi:uncharacterized protein B0I36DRAFT_357141 [Microdochium trichocladiopsis]|uniref:Clr5 domain-containing protein n=1 Tax=Microdochium trichocladiopsis TaxID=1682393 RepID=A0A9P9BT96_9PEZI|nr:uncharacterized protein B0I36DRAFT_357141 [Microdochium trichocladiopsis]KAH7039746.1 hypothetical protein B0I36DRAFT_357141 [Microdochium trichocladiopsis]